MSLKTHKVISIVGEYDHYVAAITLNDRDLTPIASISGTSIGSFTKYK